MEKLSYKLPAFEGPLDLLLHLVQKNKLNIYDIPIAEILEQYLAAIREMERLDMEVATEFLNMAARLVQIKSYLLLPKYEEESEEMRRELTGELIEYQLCREMAAKLAPAYIGMDVYERKPMVVEPDMTYRRVHSPEVLMQAYLAAVGRGQRKLPPPPSAFRGIVSRRIVSVSSRIVTVLRRLRQDKKMAYDDVFSEAESRSDLVATFLALLELVKAHRVQVSGEPGQQVVEISETAMNWDEPLVSDFDKEESEQAADLTESV